MTKIISTHSFRGGTGKSNITANIATVLAQRGFRVGVFDTDIQSPGIHVIFGLNEDNTGHTLNDYLWGQCTIQEASHKVLSFPSGGAVYLVPSSIDPNSIARILRDKYDANDMHTAFRDLIASHSLDYLLIDTHPGLNEETLLSIAISDTLLIVLRPDQQDFQGTSVTVDVAKRLRVPDVGILVNKIPPEYDADALSKRVADTYECDVAATIYLSTKVVQNGSASIFCLTNPDAPFSQAIEKIVNRLTAEMVRA
jgi:MinD-like ATPase involved in chromosome partitioning or flagellar assembly